MRIERTLDPQQHAALRLALTQVPSTEFTVIGVQSPSVTWIGTRQGAIRLTPQLPDARVLRRPALAA